jgi:hypothetical protein
VEKERLLKNEQFLKSNNRIGRVEGDGRSHSRQGAVGVDDDPDASFAQERDRQKMESHDKTREAADALKKRQKDR